MKEKQGIIIASAITVLGATAFKNWGLIPINFDDNDNDDNDDNDDDDDDDDDGDFKNR
uniref:Uncharacterized protein n=1 Tax=Glossina morsitans morsitans TaxID=37546 RepID=A0A1B0FCY3_GLOMM